MPSRKRISLTYELALLAHALEGANLLADQRLDGDLSQSTTGALASMLTLIRQRLKLLSLTVRDAIDPEMLWCPENSALPVDTTIQGERDRTFVAWSAHKTARRAGITKTSAEARERHIMARKRNERPRK